MDNFFLLNQAILLFSEIAIFMINWLYDFVSSNSVCNHNRDKGTVSDTEVLASGIPRVRSWVLYFSSCLSMTYLYPGKVGMAYLLIMPLSMLALQF